jgi:hypothetical protein
MSANTYTKMHTTLLGRLSINIFVESEENNYSTAKNEVQKKKKFVPFQTKHRKCN